MKRSTKLAIYIPIWIVCAAGIVTVSFYLWTLFHSLLKMM